MPKFMLKKLFFDCQFWYYPALVFLKKKNMWYFPIYFVLTFDHFLNFWFPMSKLIYWQETIKTLMSFKTYRKVTGDISKALDSSQNMLYLVGLVKGCNWGLEDSRYANCICVRLKGKD